jgi:hypothetical protein
LGWIYIDSEESDAFLDELLYDFFGVAGRTDGDYYFSSDFANSFFGGEDLPERVFLELLVVYNGAAFEGYSFDGLFFFLFLHVYLFLYSLFIIYSL